jgi:2,4-dienoyl-CoA reductase-like NADH-dependent reductase (Old Yellow Enzyme family)
MKFKAPGSFRSAEVMRAHLRELLPDLDMDLVLEGSAGPLGQSLDIGSMTLGNRFAIHPMEGWDGTPEGAPSAATLRRWRGFGRSTAKMIWGGEAFAVCPEGRANPNQLHRAGGQDVPATLAALLAEVHAGHREMGAELDDLCVGLQLTHSGRFARPFGEPAPKLATRNPVLEAHQGLPADLPLLTDTELEGIGEAFVATAKLALEAGFHFVDVKACHGYLLHELLGARTRPGPYGGDLKGRTRFMKRVIDGIRAECPGLVIGSRISIADVYPHRSGEEHGRGEPHGWDAQLPYPHGLGLDADDPRQMDLREPFELLKLLRSWDVRLVSLSLGSPYTTPHLQRPAAYPPSAGYLPPRDPLLEVGEHLRTVRQCKAAFPDMIFAGSGYSYLMEYLPHVAQHEVRAGHVDLPGLGRMALVYPELPADVLAGRPLERRKICRTFSDCTSGPRLGFPSGCYPLDPYYKDSPAAADLVRAKRDF